MSNEQISLLVLASFSLAFIFASVLNRPRVVIQPEHNNESTLGCIASLGTLLALALLVIWIMTPKSVVSFPEHNEREFKKLPDDGKQAHEHFNIGLDSSYPSSTETKRITSIRINERSKFQWVVQIRRFTTNRQAASFIEEELPFPGADVLPLSNGQFMVALKVDSQASGEAKLENLKEKYGAWLPALKVLRLRFR